MSRWNFSPKKILHFLRGETEESLRPRQPQQTRNAGESIEPRETSELREFIKESRQPGGAGMSSGPVPEENAPGCKGEHGVGSCSQAAPGPAAKKVGKSSCSRGTRGIPDYLENNLIRFAYLLRAEGMRIGSSEVIDALHALQHVPIEKRNEVRAALKATLVKKPEDQGVFDRTFDFFFTSSETREEFRQQREQKISEHEKKMKEADEVFNFRGEQMELTDMEKTVYAYMPEKEKHRLQEFIDMNKSRDTLKQEYRPFLESLVKGRLNFWHRQLRRDINENVARPDIGDEDLNSIRDAMGAGEQQGGNSILTEDMQYIARQDLPQATVLIRKMARLLVTRISRRYRVTRKRHQLDLRSTIRGSIQYGGVPFKLRYKSRRIRKPKLLLLCDVSGSMVRYTSFVLQFIYGLNAAVQRIESFVFSENVERVTPYFQQGQDFNRTMASLVRESSEWGRGTSLHKALKSLLHDYSEELTRNTIVIIVSDTRTIRHRDALEELNKVRERVKEILWLNTLPADEWEKYSTVSTFQKAATMFPCNTLSDLEQVMSKKLLA